MARDSDPLVWIVDDSPADAEVASRALAAGHRLKVFVDGTTMLEQLAEQAPPDVLVLDVVLPDLSGLEVLRFLRDAEQLSPRRTGVLLVTARGGAELVEEALTAGADDYVVKPYAEVELRARVRTVLRQQRLLERAREAERSLRSLLDHAPEALAAVCERNLVVYANRELEQVVGRRAADLIGAPLGEVLPGLEIGAGAGRLDPGETRQLGDLRLGGRVFAPSLRPWPREGRLCVLLSLRDVTEARLTATRQLDFYSIVAHDLRTPLWGILLRTGVILRGKRGALPAKLIDDLHQIERNVRGLVAMVNDFLELARLESPDYGLDLAPLDLGKLVRDTATDFQPLIAASHLTWQLAAPPRPFQVLGDARRLAQVVSNLLGNAIKFTPAGGAIRCRLARQGDRARVELEDTGRGIAPELLPRLFQRYSREERHSVGGTGLGLMIVREIIEAHRGEVGVQSEFGRGSTFWFELPLDDGPPV